MWGTGGGGGGRGASLGAPALPHPARPISPDACRVNDADRALLSRFDRAQGFCNEFRIHVEIAYEHLDHVLFELIDVKLLEDRGEDVPLELLAAFLAFLLIGERLAFDETACIVFGVLGTTMLTMPQWFMFMGI